LLLLLLLLLPASTSPRCHGEVFLIVHTARPCVQLLRRQPVPLGALGAPAPMALCPLRGWRAAHNSTGPPAMCRLARWAPAALSPM
jgi:hypothetical protein